MQESTHTRNVTTRALSIAVHRAVIVFILDRVTKQFFFSLPLNVRTPFETIITLVHHENRGAIANTPLPLPLIVVITVAVLLLVLHSLYTNIREGNTRAASALGILLGGAAGNLFDRVAQGFVFDWILLFGRSAINIADIAIVLGAVLFFVEKRREDSSAELTPHPQR